MAAATKTRPSKTGMPTTTVRVEASELRAAAAWAARIVPLRPTLPILGGVVIGCDDEGRLTLSAFDYETSGRIVVDGADEVFAEPVLVHGRLLADAAARMGDVVALELDERALTLRAGATRVVIRRMAADQYPTLPPTPAAVGRLDGTDLARLVQAAAVCASKESMDPLHLYALRLVAQGGTLHAWATDRYRAAHAWTDWAGQDFSALVRADALLAATKGLSGSVTVGADTSRVSVTGSGRTTSLILTDPGEGNDALVRTESLWTARGGSIVTGREVLADAVGTARLALDDAKRPVLLTLGDGTLAVHAGGDRSEAAADVEATIADCPDALTLAVNATYLSDALGALDTDLVRLDLEETRPDRRPIEIRGADADGEPQAGLSCLVVPIDVAKVTR